MLQVAMFQRLGEDRSKEEIRVIQNVIELRRQNWDKQLAPRAYEILDGKDEGGTYK